MKVFGGLAGAAGKPRGGRLSGEEAWQAFRYAQSLPNVSTVVLGMNDSRELQQNIEWARNWQPLTPDELKTLLAQGKTLAGRGGEVYEPVT